MAETSNIRVRDDQKREHAELLYMNSIPNKEIARRVDISPNTLTSWISAFGWKEKRAARVITRSSLVNKMLLQIDQMLDESLEGAVDGQQKREVSGDKLSKIAAAIDKLDKKSTLIDIVEIMTDFYNELSSLAQGDRSITQEKLQWLTKQQDRYINAKFDDNR